mgnify:CR=1 FL=1
MDFKLVIENAASFLRLAAFSLITFMAMGSPHRYSSNRNNLPALYIAHDPQLPEPY